MKTKLKQKEVELAHVELGLAERRLGLIERRVALACRLILLAISVALTVTTIICVLRGYSWTVTAGAGGFGVAAANVLVRSPFSSNGN